MKKVFVSILAVLSLFVFAACDFGGLFIDDVAVHNDLVDKMDVTLDAEEAFYDVYIALYEGDELTDIKAAFETFSTAVADLDEFFEDTKFAESQGVFKTEYEEYYKGFVSGYIDYAGDFITALEENGVTFDAMDPFLDQLDSYTLDFVDIHNRLINTINLQSDEV